MYKINHRVASVRWREAELFGTYGQIQRPHDHQDDLCQAFSFHIDLT